MVEGTSGGECYGEYDSSTATGSGAGYVNSCVHSGSNTGTSGNTVWYNYATASAGTIIGATSTNNTNIATESICPKGWTLPTAKQIDTLTGNGHDSSVYVDDFSSVYGGYYVNGAMYLENNGYWWSSNIQNNGMRRYNLGYTNIESYLYSTGGARYSGIYIRCVSEEKDVSDLTYMQDMTPSVATFAARIFYSS